MSYNNVNSRSARPNRLDTGQQYGRMPSLFGSYIGYVKNPVDVQRNGRLGVWIPELGSAPDDPRGWVTANYCSPFGGSTNVAANSNTDLTSDAGTQSSYGFWAVPPDINNEVIVQFIGGDPAKAIWIGCLYNQFMNGSVPATPANPNNHSFPGTAVPITEYNKNDKSVTSPDKARKPMNSTKFNGVANQGLIKDDQRGLTSSSARRESPSQVFGMSTPGPAMNDGLYDRIRRTGGSSFVMDDREGSEHVEFSTKSGAKIKIDETNGFIYAINRDGTGWIEIDTAGNMNVFAAGDASYRAGRDFNIRADRNVNIEAGQDIFIKAAKDTAETTKQFTYGVNVGGKPTNIRYWENVGQGNGDGGNVVIESLGQMHNYVHDSMFIKVVNNDLDVQVGNSLKMTTIGGGQDFNSKMSVNITSNGAMNIASSGDMRVNSGNNISLAAKQNISMCAKDTFSINGDAGVILSSTAMIGVIGALVTEEDVLITGNLATIGSIVSSTSITANKSGIEIPVVPYPNSPDTAQRASTATSAKKRATITKINVQPDWSDPDKFKRNSAHVESIVSRLPTYEPYPERPTTKLSSLSIFNNLVVRDYGGSSGGTLDEIRESPKQEALDETTIEYPGGDDTGIQTKDFDMSAFMCQLKIHEGYKTYVYLDSVGLPTAGIGHLLRAPSETNAFPVGSPVSTEQINAWFQEDCKDAIGGAISLVGIDVWENLTSVRKRAMADLCYNLGRGRLSKFTKFLGYMKSGEYSLAGGQLIDSKWYKQVGQRGPKIVKMIVDSVDVNGCDTKRIST